AALGERELTLLRRTTVGFVFQFFNLVPTLTVRENVAFPLHLLGIPRGDVQPRVEAALEDVGLAHRAKHFPNELSGGEMQRVAIARAVVHRPAVVLADEPTGNLDTATGAAVLDLLSRIHEEHRPTIVMATHSAAAAARGDFVVEMVDGRVARRGAA
ncbi:MAG: ABC transporter ATP-binding protein, partial [Thermoanaerobaculia bacterium]